VQITPPTAAEELFWTGDLFFLRLGLCPNLKKINHISIPSFFGGEAAVCYQKITELLIITISVRLYVGKQKPFQELKCLRSFGVFE
jgi:hypothetical protein